MRKWLIIAAVLCGLGFLARRFALHAGQIDWEQKFAAMPDNSPPKWMFGNITAIRDNTDRILDLLQGASADDAVPPVTAPGHVRVGGGTAGAAGGDTT